MKIKSFEFNMRELAGSMGDFGTLFPLAIGYITVCGINPAGLLVMMGLANVLTGLIYRLPMPIEPMKVLAVVAIAQNWVPSMVYASGFAMGIIWLILAFTGVIGWVSRFTPNSVVRGIQITLGVMLAIEAIKMISTGWALGIISIIIVLIFRENRHAPAAVVLMALGMAIVFFKGQFQQFSVPSFNLPVFTKFSISEVWQTMMLAGFAQIPLTVTNAVIATASLIKIYWPDKNISEKQLSWNQGIMNVILPFFGGMPTCHGAGGLAGQYYFGARTGGTNIIEGAIEICLGLFFAGSIVSIFSVFPTAIIGSMMFLVGIELTKFAKDLRFSKDIIPMASTVITALAANMAYGFIAGLLVHHLTRMFFIKKDSCKCRAR
jgi:hypothetical protein